MSKVTSKKMINYWLEEEEALKINTGKIPREYPPKPDCEDDEWQYNAKEIRRFGWDDTHVAQNHMYKCELGEGQQLRKERLGLAGINRCMQYEKSADDLGLYEGYNWASQIQSKTPHVLYGTAYAQKKIWSHQNPQECYNAKFLKYRHGNWVGSIANHISVLGQALALAMNLGRVLILDDDDPNFPFADPESCPDDQTWGCYWQPISHCQGLEEEHYGADVLQKEGIDELNGLNGDPAAEFNEAPGPLGEYDQWDKTAIEEDRFTLQSVPRKFKDLLDCSPIKNTHYHYWWRAQATTYFMRWNTRTRKAMDKFRYRTLNNPGPDGHIAPYSISIFVPRGTEKKYVRPGTLFDKSSGGDVRSGSIYQSGFDPYITAAKRLTRGKQDIPVLRMGLSEAENVTFQYPKQEFNTRSLFVNPESDKGLEELIDATMGQFKTWAVSYMEHDRIAPDEDTLQVALGHVATKATERYRRMIATWTNLELMLEGDAIICPVASSMCRLIDWLRMTVAGKAGIPFMDVETGMGGNLNYCLREMKNFRDNEGNGNRHCYLGW